MTNKKAEAGFRLGLDLFTPDGSDAVELERGIDLGKLIGPGIHFLAIQVRTGIEPVSIRIQEAIPLLLNQT